MSEMVGTPTETVVLATRNEHKLLEVRRILAPLGLAVQALGDDVVLPPEDGDTFVANALGKARAAARAAGCAAVADDSGIEADALDGRPGVRSARYAGETASDLDNLHKLIAEVPSGTGLRYVCAFVWVPAPGASRGQERVFIGECRGRMAPVPRGARGFGYDPIFIPDEVEGERTMAELTETEKDAISHRGRAVRALAAWMGG